MQSEKGRSAGEPKETFSPAGIHPYNLRHRCVALTGTHWRCNFGPPYLQQNPLYDLMGGGVCNSPARSAFDYNLDMLRAFLWLSVAVLVAFAPGTAAKAQSASSSTSPANMVEVQVHRRTVNVPVAEGTDIRFRRLSTGAGLSQTRVEQIAQDDQGFMWFGTQFGLNRYDGYDFKVFAPNPKSADTISCGNISAVFKDRSNMLWVGCGRFLERFDPTTERFSQYRLKSSDSDSVPAHVHNIIQDRSGTLWLGTGSGLYGVDSTTGVSFTITHMIYGILQA